jgi:hypothetical protein
VDDQGLEVVPFCRLEGGLDDVHAPDVIPVSVVGVRKRRGNPRYGRGQIHGVVREQTGE